MLYHCGFTEDGIKYCIFESEDLDEVVGHVKNHAVDKRTCPICQVQLRWPKSLIIHLKRKFGIKQFSCICCKPIRKFVTRKEVHRHERSMSGTRDFSCNVCRTTYSIKANRATHFKTKYHKQRENDEIDLSKYKFHCEPCMIGFNSEKQLKQHKTTPKHKRIINYVPV